MNPSLETIWRALAPHWPASARVQQLEENQFTIGWKNADGSNARDVIVTADAETISAVQQVSDEVALSRCFVARVSAAMPPLEELPADTMPFDLRITEDWIR